MSKKNGAKHEEMELRRGPWTLEEDSLLIHYIARHGEGRWNLLARCSGLKRTGKSCRLRWLNYLKPDVKRGNLSPEEQFLILELHSKWGNRWSRIAQYLPGRTDNEIKNYWRTRVQKQARQLKIDANSTVFRDAFRCYWMPRMLEKIASSSQPVQANTAQVTLNELQLQQQQPQLNLSHLQDYSDPNCTTTTTTTTTTTNCYYEQQPSASENYSSDFTPTFSSGGCAMSGPFEPLVHGFDSMELEPSVLDSAMMDYLQPAAPDYCWDAFWSTAGML